MKTETNRATETANTGRFLVYPLWINPSIPISTLIVFYQEQMVCFAHVKVMATCFSIHGCGGVGKILIATVDAEVDAGRSLLISKMLEYTK